jgi:DNA-binding transcriptional regulator YdaS (Cro superfamily)
MRPRVQNPLFCVAANKFVDGGQMCLLSSVVMSTPLERAIEIAGGQAALARLVGKKQGHIWHWLQVDRVPGEHCLAIERETGVSRYELRPDIYGDAPKRKATA